MHRDSAMYMGHEESPANKYGSPAMESRELKDMPIVDIEKGDAKGSPAKAAKPDYLDLDKEFKIELTELTKLNSCWFKNYFKEESWA